MAGKTRVCVVRIEGSSGADELYNAFAAVGAEAEKVHLKQLSGDCPAVLRRDLGEYDVLALPGGMAGGNYVRPGAIMAARLKTQIGKELKGFVDSGKFVLGVNNGFQALAELGLLPSGAFGKPTMAFICNPTGAYECRDTYVDVLDSRCAALSAVPRAKCAHMPTAQMCGGIVFETKKVAGRLIDDGQIPFVYAKPEGDVPKELWNPSGIPEAVAAVCNPAGNVLGMMPMPQRAMTGYSEPGWNRKAHAEEGLGAAVLRSIVGNVR
ncbi:MAG: phosphoribosylformylglycinamidine synthase subunit PurQ [Thermoplasmatales archaeon]|nr:phosphoribosylformylglycinamidine synthase subunit PurQ [Thermoplasmatales archaeon]